VSVVSRDRVCTCLDNVVLLVLVVVFVVVVAAGLLAVAGLQAPGGPQGPGGAGGGTAEETAARPGDTGQAADLRPLHQLLQVSARVLPPVVGLE